MKNYQKIQSTIDIALNTESSKNKYLDILERRIEDNRKLMGKISLSLLIIGLSFPLILETKISEFSLGPLKIIDTKIIISLTPIVFTFLYFKYLMIWFDLVEQKKLYKILSANIFKIEIKSFLNERLRPFSITDSVEKHHSNQKLDKFGVITYLLWIPTGFFILISPLAYELFLIKKLHETIKPESLIEWTLFISPILITTLTIIMFIQVINNSIKEDEFLKD